MSYQLAQDFKAAASIGRQIAADHPEMYSPNTIVNMMERINFHIPDAEESYKQEILYSAVYDWFAFGANINEVFAYRFFEKTHTEKAEYLVGHSRTEYVNYLNGGFNWDTVNKLENKWFLYQRLAPYFKREMIHIVSAADFSQFEAFVNRHPVYVVKPLDCSCGVGVHLDALKHYSSVKAAFLALLNEGKSLNEKHPTRGTEMVLEEVIQQEETMASLHPQSVNALRITTVRRADGKMIMYRPRIKIGMNGAFLASAAQNGVIAEIDPETGIIRTDGFNENGEHYLVHPDSKIPIKGFQIPQWSKLLELVEALNQEMHEFGYIGWDLVLSKSGWCVMEGNYSGEQASQVILGKGLRREFEELIGWKPEIEYWEKNHIH